MKTLIALFVVCTATTFATAAEPPKRISWTFEERLTDLEKRVSDLEAKPTVVATTTTPITFSPEPTVQTVSYTATQTCSGPNCPQQRQSQQSSGWYPGKWLGR